MIYLPLFSFLLVYFYMKWDKSRGDIVVLQPPTLSVNTYMEMTTGNLEILPLRFARGDYIRLTEVQPEDKIQGVFFNWASPENVSRLPPPKKIPRLAPL